MSERITQTQAILMYLEEHGSITCREADRKLGIMLLPSRINDLKKMGYKVEERRLALSEIIDAYKAGKLNEAFGTGTAAVVSPMGLLDTGDLKMEINNGEIGEIAQKLYDTLTGIQWGKLSDDFGWTVKID